jgi:hypothetical protein
MGELVHQTSLHLKKLRLIVRKSISKFENRRKNMLHVYNILVHSELENSLGEF